MAEKLQPGDVLDALPSSSWNEFVDNLRPGPVVPQKLSSLGADGTIVAPVKNGSGGDLARFSIVELSTSLLSPATALLQFQNQRIYTATAPATINKVGILVEPIANNGFGYAAVGGLVAAQVDFSAADFAVADYNFAEPISADSTKLRAAQTGPIHIDFRGGSSATHWCLVRILQATAASRLLAQTAGAFTTAQNPNVDGIIPLDGEFSLSTLSGVNNRASQAFEDNEWVLVLWNENANQWECVKISVGDDIKVKVNTNETTTDFLENQMKDLTGTAYTAADDLLVLENTVADDHIQFYVNCDHSTTGSPQVVHHPTGADGSTLEWLNIDDSLFEITAGPPDILKPGGRVKVNSGDGYDYLEDQFVEHNAVAQWSETDDIVVDFDTEGVDPQLRGFIDTSAIDNYSSSGVYALSIDGGIPQWVDVEGTGLSVAGGTINEDGKVLVDSGDTRDYLENQFQPIDTFTSANDIQIDFRNNSGTMEAFVDVSNAKSTGNYLKWNGSAYEWDTPAGATDELVKVNTGDTADFLEDQFADHNATPQYSETDDVAIDFDTTGADPQLRGFVDFSAITGHSASGEYALGTTGGVPQFTNLQGCGLEVVTNTLRVKNSDLAGDGLTTSGTCTLDVDPGCGLEISAGQVRVKSSDLAGDGLTTSGTCTLDVDPGCGLEISAGQVRVKNSDLASTGLAATGTCGLKIDDTQTATCVFEALESLDLDLDTANKKLRLTLKTRTITIGENTDGIPISCTVASPVTKDMVADLSEC